METVEGVVETNVPSIMGNMIWYEMTHTKYGECYLSYYIHFQKSIKRTFKICTLIFSTSGVLGWKAWDYAPVVACGIIAVMQVVGLIEHQLIKSDKDIEELCTLRNKYVVHFNKLERLWVDFYMDRATEDEVTERFFLLRQSAEDIESTDDKLHIGRLKKLCSKSDDDVRSYLKQYHS